MQGYSTFDFCFYLPLTLSSAVHVDKSKEEKNGRPVSRVLSPITIGALSFILPRHHCRSPAAYPSWLPCALETRRAALLYRDSGKQSGYTWLCNPWDVRLPTLLPGPVRFYRTFSPVPGFDTSNPGGRFLLRCYPLSKIFPLRSTAPCVARTFLIPSTRDPIKRPAGAKIKNSSGFKVQSLKYSEKHWIKLIYRYLFRILEIEIQQELLSWHSKNQKSRNCWRNWTC